MSDYDRGWSNDPWGRQAAPPPGGPPPGGAPPPEAPPAGYQQPGYPPGGYPSGGYQQPYGPPPTYQRSRGGGCLKAFAIGAGAFFALIVLVAVVALAAGGDEDEPGTGGEQPAAPAAEGGGQEVYAIGQTAHTGDFDVVVHGFEDPFRQTQFEPAPAAGQRYVGVEATVTNTGSDPLPFSPIGGAELVDQLDRTWTIAVAGTDRPQLGAPTIAPGESRRGWVVFQVASDATDLRVRIKGNLTATGSLFRLA